MHKKVHSVQLNFTKTLLLTKNLIISEKERDNCCKDHSFLFQTETKGGFKLSYPVLGYIIRIDIVKI
jgi:hypothetical protein